MRVSINNLFWFTVIALWRGIPPWRWRDAWDYVAEGHRQEVHKTVWELKCQGKVYSDKNGRLWPK